MPLNSSVSVCHRCGTCGTIFRSLRELSSHVASGHSGDDGSGESEAGYPAPLPEGNSTLRLLHAQYTSHPSVQ